MDRAYSLIEVKNLDEGKRTFTGWATTPDVDRVNDTINPLGAKFRNPLVLLHQHDADRPIGTVTFKKPTKSGIEFEAEIPVVKEPGPLKDRVDTAWGEVKAGLVRAVSIGFRSVKHAFKEDGGIDFQEVEIFELSTVSVPANASALITSVGKSMDASTLAIIKSFDPNAPAATGTIERPAKTTPGAAGKSHQPVSLRPKEGTTMKTIQEQIAAFEAKRSAKSARMGEIQTKAMEDERSKNEAEKEEFDTLADEVDAIDEELKDLRRMERTNIQKATPVNGNGRSEDVSQARSGIVVKSQPKSQPGVEFARLARAKALSHLDHEPAREIAKRLYGEESPVTALLSKAAVVAGSSISGNWAVDLVGAETEVYADFAEFLRPMTIVGKFGAGGIPSLMNIPFRTPLITQTGGGTAYWVGEGKPKPLTAFDFDRTTLDELKVAAISVVTEELLRKSSPSADILLRNSLAAAVAARIDTTFINPAVTASAGVSPASITNGVSAIASTGNDADSIREDIRALWATFIAANNPPTTAVYVMSSNTALALSLLRNPLGQTEFPGLTMNGGTFEGIPVITSEYLSPVSAGGFVALVNASDIYFGDEGGVQIDMSREASLQMLDNPTNASSDGTATTMVSMFQTNSVAFRAERILNWKKRRASAVALLDEVNWGLPSGS